MNFGFIGGTPRGFALFKALIEKGYKPGFCVVLKEDDHENTKVSEDFIQYAHTEHIQAESRKKLNDADYAQIEQLKPDFIIVCGWRTLIDPKVNNWVKNGLIAAHDSLLPEYRGFAPLNWAIINGETQTGVTLFVINDGEVDSGDIVLQKKVAINPNEDVNSVYDKIIEATIAGYLELFTRYDSEGNLQYTPQNEALATYTCKRTPEDGRIDWQADSKQVFNLIRALIYPYSGAFFYHNQVRYTVREARLGPQNHKNFSGRITGRVISSTAEGIEVLCGKGSILITKLMVENQNEIIAPNTIFKSITARLL